jgi:hypothetical protein
MTSLSKKSAMSRSGTSVSSTDENDFTTQHEENPLEIAPPLSSTQQTPSAMQSQTPLDVVRTTDEPDEPPPPYQELELDTTADAPQIACVEYSVDNGPQLMVSPELEYMEVASRSSNQVSSQAPELSPIQSPESPAWNDPSLVSAPLQVWSVASVGDSTNPPAPSQTSPPPTTFSSAKAREAGFDLETPFSPARSASSSSVPSVAILPSNEPLLHTREAGKVTAYLIPFPKPRIKGVKPEDIPERFLIYTPILPPLSKPAPGEKETHWHKTSRQWQEDVRKATMSRASAATWKGMKARTTSLIHKGVNMTRSSNVEFLDRVSGGTIAETTEEMDAEESAEKELEAESSTNPASPGISSEAPPSPQLSRKSVTSSNSFDKGKGDSKDSKPEPQPLQDLTLIYPPSLQLSPNDIRTEFIDTLLRTREKSRKDALVASTLLPFAAALDATLIVTLGGLTQVSGVWAYTSTRGMLTSRRMTKGLARGEEYAQEKLSNPEECEGEIQGCTCGHHEHTFGAPEPKPKDKKKKPKTGINLQLQQSTQIEILRRYLDIACLKKDYHLFPQIEEAAGDIGEGTVLNAIGWKPVRRQGKDLEVEFKEGVTTMTAEDDEGYQLAEAREDVKRYFRKGAAEWVAWCKGFSKEKEKGKEKQVEKEREKEQEKEK